PIDTPAPPTAPQPAIPSHPLDPPGGRSGETDPGAGPSFGSPDQGGFGPQRQGGQHQGPGPQGPPPQHPYGDDPLNTGERPSFGSRRPPATPPAPPSPPPTAVQPAASMSGPGSGSGSGEDEHKLPSVDELLAKIQSDRKRASESESSSSGSSGYDPLN